MSPVESPMSRVSRAKLGAAKQHSLYSTSETTKAGSAAFLAKFEREVDPLGVLDPAERAKRASFALQAHMIRLGHASAKARRARAAQRKAAENEGG